MKRWINKNTSSLQGKTVAISGATGGIGVRLCEHLAELGAALILLDRNREKSEALGRSLQERWPGLAVRYIRLDMEDIPSVKAAVAELEKRPVDALILNAGAYHIPRHTCATGLDNVFQINFVSPYYIARKLKPMLQSRGGRVVAVGSIAHTYSHIHEENFDFSGCTKSSKVYGNAKRFLMFSLYGLFDGQPGLAVTHPGITFTNITAHYPKWIFAIIKHPMKVIFMKPKKACLSILWGVFQDCGKKEWLGPRIFNVWGLPNRKKLSTCPDAEAAKICALAEQVYETMEKL